jgi:predicted oxidoreductase (fatty acid repression mutant protein)
MFFEDPTAVNVLPPSLRDVIKSFPEWAEHSNAMAQYVCMHSTRLSPNYCTPQF